MGQPFSDRKTHWEQVYATRKPHEVGWYQDYPDASLRLLAATGVGRDAAVIDVGGGAASLVDELLDEGYSDLTVLDISAAAIAAVRERLGEGAGGVKFVVEDITRFAPSRQYDVWHDRAVFHFLTAADDRRCYLDAARAALPAGGHLLMATFAPDGPAQCSGLDVIRYSAEQLREVVGVGFELQESFGAIHVTPSLGKQSFTFCRFVRS